MAPRKRASIDANLFAKTESQQDPPTRSGALERQEGMAATPVYTGATSKTVKATFYLDPAILAALDMAKVRLRGMAPTDRRGSITLSVIVAEALALTLGDLEQNGTKSQLAGKIVEK